MVRYTGPKNRIARKFSVNIFNRAKNPLLHKSNPPGMHGAKRKKKSDYGNQLLEKQKLKAAYGMLSDKQLLISYNRAIKQKGDKTETLLTILECRLDNIVYRLRFAPTIFAAHQLVSHGHIKVDGKKIDIRSFSVKPGMVISIKEKSKKIKHILASIGNTAREIPEYLSLNEDKTSGSLISLPTAEQIPLPLVINVHLVCEFLSHTH
ncbi:MAG: 30S ribosomal protein S4 [Chlamydiae bacterium SM23_39]|nr:MAG: 30S ribosomal protein S4 [Chlamydiae bacterium SM23_39]